MMSEMPLPRPLWLISSPNHIVSMTPVVRVTTATSISTGVVPASAPPPCAERKKKTMATDCTRASASVK